MAKSLHTLITLAVQLKLQDQLKFEDFLKGIETDYPDIFREYRAWFNMTSLSDIPASAYSMTASTFSPGRKNISIGERTNKLLEIMKKHAGISDIAL